MTNKVRRTEINIETHEVTIVRRREIFCERCRREVATFTLEQISTLLRLIESGELHSIETARGSIVCANSLDREEKF